MKKEIKEAAEKYANMHQDVSANLGKPLVKGVFEDGAKWQQERMYSEEDLREAFEEGVGSGKYQERYGDNAKGSMSFEYFIEQFKKK